MSNHITKHLYKPLFRPAAFAGLPKGWDYVEAPPDIAHKRPDIPMSRWIHGVIAYDRQLSREECHQHDLEFVGVREVN
jgi:hypothetical protein